MGEEINKMIKELAWVKGGQWLQVISFNLGTAEKNKTQPNKYEDLIGFIK